MKHARDDKEPSTFYVSKKIHKLLLKSRPMRANNSSKLSMVSK